MNFAHFIIDDYERRIRKKQAEDFLIENAIIDDTSNAERRGSADQEIQETSQGS
jgi:hypothetical protein